MPLVTAQGFNLDPNIAGQFIAGRQARQQQQLGDIAIGQAEAKTARQQQIQGALGGIFGQGGIPVGEGLGQPTPMRQPATGRNREQSLARLFSLDPELGERVFNQIGATDQRSRDDASLFAFEMSRTPPEQRPAKIQQRASRIRAEGGDPSNTMGLLQMPTNQQDMAFETMQIAALNPQQRMDVSRGTPLASLQGLTEAEGGGFIGVAPETRESVFIPAPAGKRTKPQVENERKTQEKRVEEETKALGTRFDQSQKLRKEVDNASKEFNKIESAFGRIEAVSEEPSAAGDLALIFNFMKMLDPGSTVREGEFATAQNAAGVGQRMQAQYNNIIRGERLTPKQRDDFLSQSENIFDRSKRDNKKAIDKIVSIGKRFDIPKEDILGEAPDIDVKTLTDEELQAEATRLRGQ